MFGSRGIPSGMPGLSPATFAWADAPLHSIRAPCVGAGLYLLVVGALRRHVSPSSGSVSPSYRRVQAAHNLVLCGGSLLMLLGTISELVRRSVAEPVRSTHRPPRARRARTAACAHCRATPRVVQDMGWLFCETPNVPASGPLYFWSYAYYLSKFYELGDTVLQAPVHPPSRRAARSRHVASQRATRVVHTWATCAQLLKGRSPPHFALHVYHHAMVLFMAWAWVEHRQSLQFIGMVFNCAVHVPMYWYYYHASLGKAVWWKRYHHA